MAFLLANVINSVKADSITIVYADSWAPMSYGSQEAVQGVLPTIVETLLADILQYKVTHLGVPWNRAQQMVENGTADGFVTTPTPHRLTFASSTKAPLHQLKFQAFTLAQTDISNTLLKYENTQKLPTGIKFCDVIGNSWAETFYAQHGITYFATTDINNCLKMIERNRADVLIHSRAVTSMKLKKLGLEKKIQPLPTVYKTVDFTLLVSKKSSYEEHLISAVDNLYQTKDIDKILSPKINTSISQAAASPEH